MTPGVARRSAGFTLIEALLASVVVSVMLTAAVAAVGASVRAQDVAARQWRGRFFAASLTAEVIHLSFSDPAGTGAAANGPEAEVRADFDDVDDYNGLAESPLTYKDGTPLSSSIGWARAATVEWVQEKDPGTVSFAPTRLKRITVTASYKGTVVARRVALKAGD
jgi:Tfp pilus assembly protein PilV